MDNNTGIYTITNIITIEKYVGSAVNYPIRSGKHKSMLQKGTHPNKKLQNAFNKYGSDNFIFEVIEYVANKEDLITREQYYIDTLKPTYNILKIAGNSLGYKHTEKSLHKMSESHKGNKNSLGFKHTKETKHKVSESLKGNKYCLGYKHSEEHILKKSKPFKTLSPEGMIIEGMNLKKFCKENNLNQGNMWSVLNNKLNSYKGWKKAE